MKDIEISCDICKKKIPKLDHQAVFRRYMPRPLYRYAIVDKLNLCEKCFKSMMKSVRG